MIEAYGSRANGVGVLHVCASDGPAVHLRLPVELEALCGSAVSGAAPPPWHSRPCVPCRRRALHLGFRSAQDTHGAFVSLHRPPAY